VAQQPPRAACAPPAAAAAATAPLLRLLRRCSLGPSLGPLLRPLGLPLGLDSAGFTCFAAVLRVYGLRRVAGGTWKPGKPCPAL